MNIRSPTEQNDVIREVSSLRVRTVGRVSHQHSRSASAMNAARNLARITVPAMVVMVLAIACGISTFLTFFGSGYWLQLLSLVMLPMGPVLIGAILSLGVKLWIDFKAAPYPEGMIDLSGEGVVFSTSKKRWVWRKTDLVSAWRSPLPSYRNPSNCEVSMLFHDGHLMSLESKVDDAQRILDDLGADRLATSIVLRANNPILLGLQMLWTVIGVVGLLVMLLAMLLVEGVLALNAISGDWIFAALSQVVVLPVSVAGIALVRWSLRALRRSVQPNLLQIGDDGIMIRGRTSRTIPFSQLQRATSYEETLRLNVGTIQDLLVPTASAEVAKDLADRITDRRNRHHAAFSKTRLCSILTREARDHRSWEEHLMSLTLGDWHYREQAIETSDLVDLFCDPNTPLDVRSAAGFLLSRHPDCEEVARLQSSLNHILDRTTHAALHASLDGKLADVQSPRNSLTASSDPNDRQSLDWRSGVEKTLV